MNSEPAKEPEDQSDKLKEFENSRLGISFEAYKKEGFLLPCNQLDIYAEDLISTLKTIQIDTIQPITISRKTKNKIPEIVGAEYCNWSNFIKGYFKEEKKASYHGKEKIISGRWVYEVVDKNQVLNSRGDSLMLITIRNFDTEVADDNGLTGCDDYRILILKNFTNGSLSFINYTEEPKEFAHQHVLLFNDDGVTENILKVQTIGDTIIVSIQARYQEGSGSYNLKIIQRGKEYVGFKTDEIEVNQ